MNNWLEFCDGLLLLRRKAGMMAGREEGRKKGRKAGGKEGREEGRNGGRKEGSKEGRQAGRKPGSIVFIYVYTCMHAHV